MAVVLLSGGLDSAVNLAAAAKEGKARLAVTMRYGQRAESRELEAAEALSAHYAIPWVSADVVWLGSVNGTALTRSGGPLPAPSLQELDQPCQAEANMKAVWVANRNGVFLNIAAAYAEAMGEKEVLVGFNREEAASFPDNSSDYLSALNRALSFSTLNKVRAGSYTLHWDKSRIMAEALRLELPLALVWSCYESGPERCWTCESCKRTERALLGEGRRGMEWLAKLGREP
jgi:7-cyano-7-deazaguanine synthase